MDCQWGTWEPWTSCTDSCDPNGDGNANQTRTRADTTEDNGGDPCNAADGTDTQLCSQECPRK